MSEQEKREVERDDYHELNISVSEEHIEEFKHGSAVSYEFDTSDGVLVVNAESERDLDKDWLLGDDSSDGINREYKALAGIALAMLGMVVSTVPLSPVAPMFVGGIISVLGGCYAIDQINGKFSEASAHV